MSNKHKLGTRISHKVYGLGKVTDSKPKGKNYGLEIDFDDGTARTILSTFIEIVSVDNGLLEAEQGPHIDKIAKKDNKIILPPSATPSDTISEEKTQESHSEEKVIKSEKNVNIEETSIEKLEKLIQRRNSGELTSKEFEEMKKEIMDKKPQHSNDKIDIHNNDESIGEVKIKKHVDKTSTSSAGDDKFPKLEKLKEMFDSGFISKEEMEDMKNEILRK